MGHKTVNIVLILCASSNNGLHLFQISRKYLERFKSYEADTISILIITKGHNSVNIIHVVTVLVLCTLPSHGLHLHPFSRKYLERFKSYGADKIAILNITKGHISINIARGVTVLILFILSNHGLHLYQVS